MRRIATVSLAAGGFLLILSFMRSGPANPVTREMLVGAEKLFGLSFADAKRDSMLDALSDQLKNFQAIRNREIPNSVPPALEFNPLPPGFQFQRKHTPFPTLKGEALPLPDRTEDLAFASIAQLATLIKTRKVTSEELTRMYIGRLKRYDPSLHCVITLLEDRALAQARKADDEIRNGKYRGLLHGIPYGAKDLLSTRGARTTWGSVPFRDQIFDEDATVIKRLDSAGAILLAKLSMGELAWGDVWFGGTTRNPWDTSKGSSGSSAGSASATSAGLVGFAIGTETWGSIVSPSTVCGVTGLRPTYGRVSRHGAMALSWSMDKIGPIGRSAEDCAIVFNAIYGPDGLDQTVFDAPFTYPGHYSLKDVRVGFLKSDFDSVKEKSHNDSTFAVLRSLGATLIPIGLPKNYPTGDLNIILSAEAGAAFDQLTRSGRDDLLVRQIKDAWPNVLRASRFIPAVEYIQANRIRYEIIGEMQKILTDVDFYLAPSFEGDNLLLTNLTGHPCVVLPNGFSSKGLPTSICFMGNLFDEGRLLAAAALYQKATGYHRRHPDLFR